MWIKWVINEVIALTGNPITTALVVMLLVILILGILEKFIWGECEK